MTSHSGDSSPILRVENLTKTFGGVTALKDVSFTLNEGEVHALCGENGAGKSTLIKVLCGVHPAGSYNGMLYLSGSPVEFRNITDAREAGISVIHQELALIREMTVAENVFLGSEPRKGLLIDWDLLYSQTSDVIQRYGLNLDPQSRVGDLGMGQQQLVEILKALSKNSRILLLDEPTAALTESEVEILLNIIRTLKEKSITCVYISHKLDEVFSIADRITVLRDGRSVVTLNRDETNKNEVIRHMVGREITELFPRRASQKGDVLMEVENLTVAETGKPRPILENVSFRLHAGEVLGIGGLMGAGRTELLTHIFGVYGKRISGAVRIGAEVVERQAPTDAVKRGVVLASEDRKRFGLLLQKSVGFNLSLSSLKQFVKRLLIDRHLEIKKNRQFMSALGIKAAGLDVPVESLSGGNQQKVVLGKVLMTEPRIVFLDEPTRGIDVGSKIEVYELINKLTEEGKAVILVSSELPELMGMSDRIIILSNGKIGGIFEGNQATQESIMDAAMKYN